MTSTPNTPSASDQVKIDKFASSTMDFIDAGLATLSTDQQRAIVTEALMAGLIARNTDLLGKIFGFTA